jgi:multicomponent Na+:H+ antiporter subunit G
MSAIEWVAALLLAGGGFFYLAGTAGLLRFPEVHSRLHALTKADNLGLGLVCASMALLAGSWRVAALLLFIWILALLAATVSSHLIARKALDPPARPGDPQVEE